jgi:prepilin-type N-terminal cleavage/methylation domain-containing protein
MSIQKGLKKGFTLIELMVVIVIIGILAAVAIPKLFGMSAKAKAQEVGPAAGTWVKMQLAYNMETSSWGSAEQISYKLPGGSEDGIKSETSNFKYDVPVPAAGAKKAEWKANSAFNSDPCAIGSEWSAIIGEYGETAEMKISNDDAGCLSLTPSYYSIGCSTLDEAKRNKAPECIAPDGP